MDYTQALHVFDTHAKLRQAEERLALVRKFPGDGPRVIEAVEDYLQAKANHEAAYAEAGGHVLRREPINAGAI
jgi:hypothetical protein